MNLSRWRETVNRYIVNAIILVIAWGGMFRRAFNCDTLAHMVNAWGDIEHRMTNCAIGICGLYPAELF